MSEDRKIIKVAGHDVPVMNSEQDATEFVKNFSDRNNLTVTKENLREGFLAVMFSADRTAVILICEQQNFTFVMSNNDADGFADLIKQAASENRKNL